MFNCADYVNKLLPMFANQSFADFEVICVIDGATDNTEDLVSDYCKKDQRNMCFRETKVPVLPEIPA